MCVCGTQLLRKRVEKLKKIGDVCTATLGGFFPGPATEPGVGAVRSVLAEVKRGATYLRDNNRTRC